MDARRGADAVGDGDADSDERRREPDAPAGAPLQRLLTEAFAVVVRRLKYGKALLGSNVELGIMEREIKRVAQGRYVLIPASEETAGHGTTGRAIWWKHHLAEFLRPVTQAAK